MRDEQLQLLADWQFSKEKFYSEMNTTCPLCGERMKNQMHIFICGKLNGHHKRIHDILWEKTIPLFKSKYGALKCPTEKEIGGRPKKKLAPDIRTMFDGQTFDISISIDPGNMFKTKEDKYGNIFGKKTIPMIISPNFEMHPDTLRLTTKYIKRSSLFAEWAYWLSYGLVAKVNAYFTY